MTPLGRLPAPTSASPMISNQHWWHRSGSPTGALVEPLFITNPSEAQIASDPAGQQKIAEALATGLLRYVSAP